MNRSWFESVTPEEYPEPFTARPNSEHKQKPWTRDEVFAVRVAMLNLGLEREQVEAQIESICGAEFCERPFLARRQAGG